MAERKKLPLAVRIIAWVLGVIIGLLAVIWVGEKLVFASFFFGGAKAEMPIPGLWNGFVQQGFDKLDEDTYLVAGYNKEKGKPSAIYVIDRKGKEKAYVELYKNETTAWTAHAGGVTHFGEWIYVAHNTGGDVTYCDRFSISDVLDGDGKATLVDQIAIPNQISYCSIYDGKLYAGAFYREGSDYLTPDSHHQTTPSGDKNTALLMVYSLNADGTLVSTDMKPDKVYSTLSNVQGMCLTESGKIVLATSWGLSASHLYVYDEAKADKSTISLDAWGGTAAELVYLDSKSLVQDVTAPPMAEELVYENGRVLIMCESASMKYIFGKLMSGNFVHSFPIA